MPVRYEIDRSRRLIVTTGEGCVTFPEMKDHQIRLLADPAFDPSFSQLIDVTKVTKLEVTVEQARIMVSRRVSARRAFVATEPFIFGMGRLMEAYHQSQFSDVDTGVFYDLESAMAWLAK